MPLTSSPYDSPVFREVVFADEEPGEPLDVCFLVLVLNDQYSNNQSW
jgi:hypothetical protein